MSAARVARVAAAIAAAVLSVAAQMSMPTIPGIVPSGFGEPVDRDILRSRAATERFKSSEAAVAAGYTAANDCVEHQPHGGMGYHFKSDALYDTELDPERPEVLVYERRPDGSLALNGVEHQPHGGMGYHFKSDALYDTELDPERPEVLVYERRPDGSLALNGVEHLVPLDKWTRPEPPTIMGQPLKKAEKLGFYYLHVWTWKASPTGVFADWNPDVKCPPKS
jgi:hypothetical protein